MFGGRKRRRVRSSKQKWGGAGGRRKEGSRLKEESAPLRRNAGSECTIRTSLSSHSWSQSALLPSSSMCFSTLHLSLASVLRQAKLMYFLNNHFSNKYVYGVEVSYKFALVMVCSSNSRMS